MSGKTCHAQVGIGVATLGSSCVYEEGHKNPHSYSEAKGCTHLSYVCNKHRRGCNTEQLKEEIVTLKKRIKELARERDENCMPW